LERGGQHADLFFEYRATGSLVFEDDILKSSARSVSVGLGVRVQRGDSTGVAYTQELSWEAMSRAARTASRIARGSATAAMPVSVVDVPSRYALRQVTLDVPGPRKRILLERACAAALRVHPTIVRASASYAEGVREIIVASSDGTFASDSQPMLRFHVRAVAEQGARRQTGSSGGGGRWDLSYFETSSPEMHGERAARQARTMLEARDAPAGELPVVLGPGDSGILLHEAVGHGLEADFNRKRTSNYADRMGDVVASELCSVVDDASPPHARGSINVDDEGTVPTRTVLIEQGILRSYMHDRHSAAHYGVKPSGNGRRESFASYPLPRMTNTFLLGGHDDPEDILRSIRRGIYAKSFGGGQVDISNGDFVFSLTESYLVEDGRLTAPLKDVNLVGNGPDVLRNVTMVGHDFKASDGMWTCGKEGQSVPVGVGCPTVKIASITVGGTRIS
ncbi:MAG: metallopeptidase TldD-related protein, partial [Polyangiaceae bacterium]|nr:metallopeptidase TldD-related protein [Polyangiaceae bacterium]